VDNTGYTPAKKTLKPAAAEIWVLSVPEKPLKLMNAPCNFINTTEVASAFRR
jgi:hypothetical protein